MAAQCLNNDSPGQESDVSVTYVSVTADSVTDASVTDDLVNAVSTLQLLTFQSSKCAN